MPNIGIDFTIHISDRYKFQTWKAKCDDPPVNHLKGEESSVLQGVYRRL